MARYKVEVEIENDGIDTVYIFHDDYPTENMSADMAVLKTIVETYTNNYVRTEYGRNYQYEIKTASYNIWSDDIPEHEFSIDLNHPQE